MKKLRFCSESSALSALDIKRRLFRTKVQKQEGDNYSYFVSLKISYRLRMCFLSVCLFVLFINYTNLCFSRCFRSFPASVALMLYHRVLGPRLVHQYIGQAFCEVLQGQKEGLLYWALFRATGPAMASRGKLCRKLTQTNFESIDLFLFSLSYTFITLQSYRKPTCAETAKGTAQSVN